MNPADIFTNGNWTFSQSRTMSSKRSDLMAIVMVKLKHRRSTSSPIMQERVVSKRVFKEFTIAFRKISDFVIRNSKLVGLKQSGIEMDELAQTDFTYCPSSEDLRYANKFVYKPTKWVTNSKVLAESLDRRCSNISGPSFHRHIVMDGGIAKTASACARQQDVR